MAFNLGGIVASEKDRLRDRFFDESRLVGARPFKAATLLDAQQFVVSIVAQSHATLVATTSSPLLKELLPAEVAKQNGFELVQADGGSADLLSKIKSVQIGVSCADAGVAQTGTLILSTTNDADRLVTALPRIHIALLRASDIVPDFDEASRIASKFFRETQGGVVSLVTGPSTTADIGGLLIVGVHGPKELFVSIVE